MSRPPEHIPVLFSALSVALSARIGAVTLHAVDDMRMMAEEVLPRGDDLRAAIIHFATMYEQYRRDGYAVGKFGEQLHDAMMVALNPDSARPSGPSLRRDIHG